MNLSLFFCIYYALFLLSKNRCEMLFEHCGAKIEDCIPGGLLEHFKLHLRATLHSQMPTSFTNLLHKFYAAAFKVFYHAEGGNQGEKNIFGRIMT